MDYTPVDPDAFAADPRLSDWQVDEGTARASYEGTSFSDAAELLLAIAQLADELDHHPDLDLRWPGRVDVVFSSHVTGGLTRADAAAAARVSELVAERGATPVRPQP